MSRAGYRECALVPQHAGFPGWRRTVCRWILDVCFDRDYPNTVFAMAVAYMDAYLATVRAEKATYQCVGATCIWIALKFDDMTLPSDACAQDLTEAARGHYSVKDMCRMEAHILHEIQWNINMVIPHTFVRMVLSDRCDPLCDWAMILFPKGKCPVTLALAVVRAIEQYKHYRVSHPFLDVMRSKTNEDLSPIARDILTSLEQQRVTRINE